MGLVKAPYSSKMLADANDVYFQLQPYRGGYIVTDHGTHIGYIKKVKAGWQTKGWPEESLRRACRLVDEGR